MNCHSYNCAYLCRNTYSSTYFIAYVKLFCALKGTVLQKKIHICLVVLRNGKACFKTPEEILERLLECK